MSLLVTRVLGNVVEVLAADDQGAVHLGRDNGASQDTATDGDEAGEGALLVCESKVVSKEPIVPAFCMSSFAQVLHVLCAFHRAQFVVARASS